MNQNNPMSKKERYSIFIIFLFGLFISGLDSGVIGPVLPLIQSTFNITVRLSSWMYTIFILFVLIGSPIVAKLSDFYGQRKTYVLCLLLFGVGSLLIAFSNSFYLLLVGRSLQGLGAGGLYPVCAAFVGDHFPVDGRGFAIGIIGSVWGISTIVAPIFGALIIPFGWEWLFIINVPLVIILIIFALKIIPVKTVSESLNVDWLGIILLSLTGGFLSYGINQIDTSNLISSILSINVWFSLLMFVILLPILIKFENNSANSVIPMDMLKNREIRISSYTSFLYGIIETVIIYIPSLAILSLALNYEQASLVMLPFVITTTIAALFIGKALDKYGSRRLMTTGSFTMVIGLVLMGYFSYNLYLFIIGEVLASYGMLTLIGAPLRYLILSETAPGERGSGQAIVNMLSSVGQIIGGALIGAIIASYNGTIVGYHYTYILVVIFGVITYYLTRKLKSRQEQLKAMKKNS